MKILAIETSCDETGISLLDIHKQNGDTHVEIIANELTSQAADHEEYGGVFPTLAKRLHGQNFAPLFTRLCQQTKTTANTVNQTQKAQIQHWLQRHEGLPEKLTGQAEAGLPDADYIAVTVGPGLTPALYVGINIARSLALISDTPLLPVNHMSGHVISTRVPNDYDDTFILNKPERPSVALLASGGHTELIKETADGKQTKIGQTRDDAAGEAFDKVGRLLGLDYPAGPQVSRLARQIRNFKLEIRNSISLPRPMIDRDGLDFSFAGLKSAAVRLTDKLKPLDDTTKAQLAYELESAIVEVLVSKTKQAVSKYDTQSVLAGGGVVANQHLRDQLKDMARQLDQQLFIAPFNLTTDNAVMIGLAAGRSLLREDSVTHSGKELTNISANSRLSL